MFPTEAEAVMLCLLFVFCFVLGFFAKGIQWKRLKKRQILWKQDRIR